jgi:hypothetical protein
MNKRVEDTEATQLKWSCEIEGEYQIHTMGWNWELEAE